MTERPSAEQLAEWRRLADAATPGPWSLDRPVYVLPQMRPALLADKQFVIAARQAVPALLDLVELRDGQLGDYEWDIAQCRDRLTQLEARLADLLPVARAAVALDKAHANLDITLDDETTAGALFAVYIDGYRAAFDGLVSAVAALPDDIRAELEAGDADRG